MKKNYEDLEKITRNNDSVNNKNNLLQQENERLKDDLNNFKKKMQL